MIIAIIDNPNACQTCDGEGGWDVATDPEVYDKWESCPDCLGSGENQDE